MIYGHGLNPQYDPDSDICNDSNHSNAGFNALDINQGR